MEVFPPELIGAVFGGGCAVVAALIVARSNRRIARTVQRQPTPSRKIGERNYRVDGKNEDGSAYSGVAFVRRLGRFYRIREYIAEDEFQGSARATGEGLTIALGPHIVRYEILSTGELIGAWGSGGEDRLVPVNERI